MIFWQLPSGYLQGLNEVISALENVTADLQAERLISAGNMLEATRELVHEGLDMEAELLEVTDTSVIAVETTLRAAMKDVRSWRDSLAEAMEGKGEVGDGFFWLEANGRQRLVYLAAALDRACASEALTVPDRLSNPDLAFVTVPAPPLTEPAPPLDAEEGSDTVPAPPLDTFEASLAALLA